MTIDMFKCIVKISDYFKQLRKQPLFCLIWLLLVKMSLLHREMCGVIV